MVMVADVRIQRVACSEQAGGRAGVLSLAQGHFDTIRSCLAHLSVGMMKKRGQLLTLSFKSRDE